MLPTYRFQVDDQVMLTESYRGLDRFLFGGICTIIEMERTYRKQWIYHIKSEQGYTQWVEENDIRKPEDNATGNSEPEANVEL